METQTKKIPAALLKLVQRPATKDGKPVTKVEAGEKVPVLRAIKAEEVFHWTEGEHVVFVVTVDGQKFHADKPAPAPNAEN